MTVRDWFSPELWMEFGVAAGKLAIFGAFLALVYVATNRLSYVLVGLVLFLAGAWFFAGTVGHVQDRVDIWIDPFAANAPDGAGQITSALFTQAEGGLFGQGLGESLLKLPGPFAPSAEACGGETFPSCGSILPEPHTDYIFSVIGEEFGLIACMAIAVIYCAIVVRVLVKLLDEDEPFAVLAAAGLACQFGLQALINMAVNVQLAPSKGMTLPFISYGGSSMLALSIGMGLLLAFTRANPYLKRSPYVVKWSEGR